MRISVQKNLHQIVVLDLKRISLDRILRLSKTGVRVKSSRCRLDHLFCSEPLGCSSFQRCSSPNQFDNPLPGIIYNLSLIAFRWTDLDPSSLNLRSWRGTELVCHVELLHSFSLRHSSQCPSLETPEERLTNYSLLRCGCRYKSRLIFDQVYLQEQSSAYPADALWNQFNVTRDEFQTRKINFFSISLSVSFDVSLSVALESVGNLRLKSFSSVSKSIEAYYARPEGWFDQLVLTCEMIPTNEQRVFVNSNVCRDLRVGEFYRVSIETQREGWQSISSTFLQVHLQSTSELIVETNTNDFLSPCQHWPS